VIVDANDPGGIFFAKGGKFQHRSTSLSMNKARIYASPSKIRASHAIGLDGRRVHADAS